MEQQAKVVTDGLAAVADALTLMQSEDWQAVTRLATTFKAMLQRIDSDSRGQGGSAAPVYPAPQPSEGAWDPQRTSEPVPLGSLADDGVLLNTYAPWNPLAEETKQEHDESHYQVDPIPKELTDEQMREVGAHFKTHEREVTHMIGSCFFHLWDAMKDEFPDRRYAQWMKLIPHADDCWVIPAKKQERQGDYRAAFKLIQLRKKIHADGTRCPDTKKLVDHALALIHLQQLICTPNKFQE